MRMLSLFLGMAFVSAGSATFAQDSPSKPAAPEIQLETPKVPADVKAPAAENPAAQGESKPRENRAEARREAREERVEERQGAREERREARDGRTPENRWRYRWFNNHWWYWQPNNTWVFYHRNRWVPFSVETYFTYYPRNAGPERHRMGYRGEENQNGSERPRGRLGEAAAAVGAAIGNAVDNAIDRTTDDRAIDD